jgi:hypothetical protein
MGKVSHWRSVFGVVYTYLLFVASRTLEGFSKQYRAEKSTPSFP